MRSVVLVASLCLLAVSSPAQERPLPEQQSFLQEVRKHLETDDERQSGYAYTETRREQKLDSAGKPTGETVKVVESYPGLPGERRWSRMISEDGRPVPPAELEKGDRERRAHVEVRGSSRRIRRASAPRQDRERERERRERSASIDDIFRVFEVRILHREAIEGHDTIAFSLTPRPDVKARTRDGNILSNFQAARGSANRTTSWCVSKSRRSTRCRSASVCSRASTGVAGGIPAPQGERRGVAAGLGQLYRPARVALVKVMRRGGTLVLELQEVRRGYVDDDRDAETINALSYFNSNRKTLSVPASDGGCRTLRAANSSACGYFVFRIVRRLSRDRTASAEAERRVPVTANRRPVLKRHADAAGVHDASGADRPVKLHVRMAADDQRHVERIEDGRQDVFGRKTGKHLGVVPRRWRDKQHLAQLRNLHPQRLRPTGDQPFIFRLKLLRVPAQALRNSSGTTPVGATTSRSPLPLMNRTGMSRFSRHASVSRGIGPGSTSPPTTT